MGLLNRREFTAASLAAGAVATLPGRIAFAANEEIQVGLISCGSRAGALQGALSKVLVVNIVVRVPHDDVRRDKANTRLSVVTT